MFFSDALFTSMQTLNVRAPTFAVKRIGAFYLRQCAPVVHHHRKWRATKWLSIMISCHLSHGSCPGCQRERDYVSRLRIFAWHRTLPVCSLVKPKLLFSGCCISFEEARRSRCGNIAAFIWLTSIAWIETEQSSDQATGHVSWPSQVASDIRIEKRSALGLAWKHARAGQRLQGAGCCFLICDGMCSSLLDCQFTQARMLLRCHLLWILSRTFLTQAEHRLLQVKLNVLLARFVPQTNTVCSNQRDNFAPEAWVKSLVRLSLMRLVLIKLMSMHTPENISFQVASCQQQRLHQCPPMLLLQPQAINIKNLKHYLSTHQVGHSSSPWTHTLVSCYSSAVGAAPLFQRN